MLSRQCPNIKIFEAGSTWLLLQTLAGGFVNLTLKVTQGGATEDGLVVRVNGESGNQVSAAAPAEFKLTSTEARIQTESKNGTHLQCAKKSAQLENCISGKELGG